MKKSVTLLTILFFSTTLLFLKSFAQEAPPDTVNIGIYINSIHDIDFKEKEYTATFWIWMDYTAKEFDFPENIEIPQAKTMSKSFVSEDSMDGRIYVLMKMQCVMKDSWKIDNFPFDRQKLRLSIENSQYDSRSLVFKADTLGKHFDPRFTISGWNIDSFDISVVKKPYETGFGDISLDKPRTEYSAFRVKIGIQRKANDLFWKMFLGMYVAFLISYVCYYIHADSVESRFGLTVGSLFASIGNKYVIDSALPETSSFTLVDTLHGYTLLFIFVAIISSVVALKLIKEDKVKLANKLDMIVAPVMLGLYIIINIIFITRASWG